MLLRDLSEEFVFSCECRKLSPKTIHNYKLQVGYLLDYLSQEHGITQLEKVKPQMIKQYMMTMQKRGRKPQYINDLLKAFKCFFRYVFDENYTDVLITEKIKNVKQPKVIIQTFSNDEVRKLLAIQGTALSDDNFDSLDITFSVNRPVDTSSLMNELNTQYNMGAISKQTIIDISPYTVDVSSEMKRIEEEKKATTNITE